MAIRNSTCTKCKEKFPTPDMLVIKSKKYCMSCAKELEEEEARKLAEEQNRVLTFKCGDCGNDFPVAVRHKDKKDRCPECYDRWRKEVEVLNRLKDYIWEQQGRDKVKIKLAGKQIQDYIEQYGYSYNGIYLTLRYYVEYKQGSIADSIGIVPYIYEEARKYWKHRQELLDHIKAIDKPLVSYRTIKFKPEEHKPRLNLPDIHIEDIQV